MTGKQTSAEHQILTDVINDLLSYLEQDRERQIITRRFGLDGKTETLEQIGEFLGITRERVRQLEKAILIRLKIAADDGKIANLPAFEKLVVRQLTENGNILMTKTLTKNIFADQLDARDDLTVAFIAEVSNKLVLIDENDSYAQAIAIAEFGDAKTYRKQIDEIVKLIKTNKQPLSLEELDAKLDYNHPKQILALATVSKTRYP